MGDLQTGKPSPLRDNRASKVGKGARSGIGRAPAFIFERMTARASLATSLFRRVTMLRSFGSLALLVSLSACAAPSSTLLVAPDSPTVLQPVTESTTVFTAKQSFDDSLVWDGAPWGAAMGFAVYDQFDADFRIASQREEWDRTQRVELTFHSREPVHGRVEALIGGYVFREERDWDEGNQEVIVDAWGVGVDAGAMLYPFEGAQNRQLNVGIAPYARLGLGVADGEFQNIDTNVSGTPGFASGDIGKLRFDFGIGVDVRAVVGRSFYFGVGTGWNWWTTTDASDGTTRDGVGTILIADDEFDFDGSEGYIRATLGFYW